jgi:hypothetical protein
MTKITSKTLKSATPSSSIYFIRDSELKGFAIRVFPSGTIKYIVEIWNNWKSHRKSLGSYPVIGLKEARQEAIHFIRKVQLGLLDKKPEGMQVTLDALFKDYIKGDRLKPNTLKSYKEVIFFYLNSSICLHLGVTPTFVQPSAK